MTNAEIIISNMAILIEKGIIKPENEINTYIGWRMKGYQVKKGAEHVADFPIWVKSKKKKEQPEENEEEQKTETKKQRPFILQKAFWFTNEQVEKIKQEA